MAEITKKAKDQFLLTVEQALVRNSQGAGQGNDQRQLQDNNNNNNDRDKKTVTSSRGHGYEVSVGELLQSKQGDPALAPLRT